MFRIEIPCSYQDFKSENLCCFKCVLSSGSENTGLVTRNPVNSSQLRNETPFNSKGCSFITKHV